MDKKENNSSGEIDLRTLFRLFLKRKWWFIATILIVAVMGFVYIIRIPVLYEARYKFSLRDDYVQDEYLQYSESQEKFIENQQVFIGISDISLILKTDLIFSALDDIPEIESYKPYVNSSLIKIDLDKDAGVFSLKVKDENKKLAKEIGLKLIESLGEQIKNQDIEIFDNTLKMAEEDIRALELENNTIEEKIAGINEEINDIYSEMGSTAADESEFEIVEKKGELLIYKEKIIENEEEINKLNGLYQELTDERDSVENRIELLTEEPSIDVENNRAINSIIVILLSILTGIVVVIIVNYIYKLRQNKN